MQQIWRQVARIALRDFNDMTGTHGPRGQRAIAIGERYGANIARALGSEFDRTRQVPRSIYMGLRAANGSNG